MKQVKALNPGDKKLKEVSTEVTDFGNPTYRKIIEEAKEICIKEQVYAAAAPQFGVLKRFIWIIHNAEKTAKDVEELGNKFRDYKTTPYFNPEITVMKGKQYFYEGCMSAPNTVGKVARPYYIVVEAFDINGKPFKKKAEGFEAIVLCHEVDHLNGIEFTDRAEVLYQGISWQERIDIRKNYPHEIVDEKNDFEYSRIKPIIIKNIE